MSQHRQRILAKRAATKVGFLPSPRTGLKLIKHMGVAVSRVIAGHETVTHYRSNKHGKIYKRNDGQPLLNKG